MIKKNNYSTIKKLREQNKSNDYLELMVSNISLEDLVCLKLEVTFKYLGIPLEGFPIWKTIPSIIKDALSNFALSYTGSTRKASRLLGISTYRLNQFLKEKNDVDNRAAIKKNL